MYSIHWLFTKVVILFCYCPRLWFLATYTKNYSSVSVKFHVIIFNQPWFKRSVCLEISLENQHQLSLDLSLSEIIKRKDILNMYRLLNRSFTNMFSILLAMTTRNLSSLVPFELNNVPKSENCKVYFIWT